MNARFNNNVVSAVCHLDEGGGTDGKGGLQHLHLDILMITEDNRLSAKTLITRDFITSMHELADRYNKLIDDKAELERKNREKAYEVMCQQEQSR